jgi:hypothetical protein
LRGGAEGGQARRADDLVDGQHCDQYQPLIRITESGLNLEMTIDSGRLASWHRQQPDTFGALLANGHHRHPVGIDQIRISEPLHQEN